MSKELETKICQLLQPIVEVMGFQLWGCELHGQGKHTILRVFIDAEGGVTLDDCGLVSNQISGILDVEDLINSSYNLEVSSPGLDRALYTSEQFEQYIGYEVQIKIAGYTQAERRNYKGVIKSVTAEQLILATDGQEVAIDMVNIDKAKLIPTF